MSTEQLVIALSPLVVFGATELVKLLKLKLSGVIIVMIVVPALSAALAWISSLVFPEGANFWLQTGVGLLAVFVSQAISMLKAAANPVVEAQKSIVKAEATIAKVNLGNQKP